MTTKQNSKKVEKAPAVSTKPEYGGLCSTCQNARNCTYPRSLDRPILQCEEFEGFEYPSDRTTVNDIVRKSRPHVSSEDEEKDKIEYKGLCQNCEKRTTCTFPKPEGGVWRCEEYE